ncbi:hypothetical protein FS837_003744 [Tulasnella sp. UAMH 9824]|nr:hypothetical protein FS837_003744 [Tulasnella sp. UAMH 9824]
MTTELPAPFRWVQGDKIGTDPDSPFYLIYRVVDTSLAKMAVVKQIRVPSEDPSEEGFAKKRRDFGAIKNEWNILSSVEHANIVECYGAEQTAEFFNMSVLFLSLKNSKFVLMKVLNRFGAFEENLTKSFTRDVFAGLAYLRSQSIVHLAIASKNILVHLEGVCKIGGFTEAAKIVSESVSASSDPVQAERDGRSEGHLCYAAPELYDPARRRCSAKADIWSVGCVVFEMLSGQRPWAETELGTVMTNLRAEKQAPPIPGDLVLSSDLEQLFGQCFLAKAEERPRAAQMLAHPWLVLPQDWEFTGFARRR